MFTVPYNGIRGSVPISAIWPALSELNLLAVPIGQQMHNCVRDPITGPDEHGILSGNPNYILYRMGPSCIHTCSSRRLQITVLTRDVFC